MQREGEYATTITEKSGTPSIQHDEAPTNISANTVGKLNTSTDNRYGKLKRTACNLCRSRKVKCDEGKPQCVTCVKRGEACEYPPLTDSIKFLPPNIPVLGRSYSELFLPSPTIPSFQAGTEPQLGPLLHRPPPATAKPELARQGSYATMARKEDSETLEVESGNENDSHEDLDCMEKEILGLDGGDDDRSKEHAQQYNRKRRQSDQQPSKARAAIPRSISVEDSAATPGSPHRRKRAKTEDEREQRRIERLLSNRLAAEKSRERKRQEIEALKVEKQQLEQTNWDIAKRLAAQEKDLRHITLENQRLRLRLGREQPVTQGQKEVHSEDFQNEREELAVQWRELGERTEAFERERFQFAEDVRVQRRQLEKYSRGTDLGGTSTPATWTAEREDLLRKIAKLTAEMGKMTAEQQQREEEIHNSHNAHKTSLIAAKEQHATNLVNLLKQKDQELAQEHQHVVDLEQLVTLKSDALTAAETHSASRETLMKTLDALVASLEGTIKSKNEALTTQEDTIRAKEIEIESLRSELFVHKQVVEKDADSGASTALAEKDELKEHDPDELHHKRIHVQSPSPARSSMPTFTDPMAEEAILDSSAVPPSSVTLASASPQPSDDPIAATSHPDSHGAGISRSQSQDSNRQDRRSDAEDDSQVDENSHLEASHNLRRPMASRRQTRATTESIKHAGRSSRRISSDSRKTKKVKDREKKDHEEEEYSVIQYDDGMKPGHSYTQLIGMAIVESPDRQLRLAEIYKWISDTYSFYSMDTPMRKDWKNAIRSTLSTNKKFIRQWRPGEDPGKGSYWGIAEGEDEEFIGRPIYIKARSSWHRIGRMKDAAL